MLEIENNLYTSTSHYPCKNYTYPLECLVLWAEIGWMNYMLFDQKTKKRCELDVMKNKSATQAIKKCLRLPSS